MYRQNVVPCNKSRYTKASGELLEQVFCAEHSYTSSDGKQRFCQTCTCNSTLSRDQMSMQAKANKLQLDPIPAELSTLNALELRLISLRVLFMKLVALPSLVARPSHVFQHTREKSGRPGRFGDVMMTYMPPFLPRVVEIVADTSSLHHQIDQAFPILGFWLTKYCFQGLNFLRQKTRI